MQATNEKPGVRSFPAPCRRCWRVNKSTANDDVPDVTRASLFICAPARSTAAAFASRCTRASSRRQARATSGFSRSAAWRETPYFTDAERAALALTEAATRLSDRSEPVSDEVWNEAARHYDEAALSALVIQIALINFWNRINAATRQIAGSIPH